MNKLDIISNILKIIITIELAILSIFIVNKIAENQNKIQKLEQKMQKFNLNYKLYQNDFCEWEH